MRHLLVVSEELHNNAGVGRTILLRYKRQEAWATLVSFIGLPAQPNWADYVLDIVQNEKRVQDLDGIGCQPVMISATTEEILSWVSNGIRSQALDLPAANGPIAWPSFALDALLESALINPT